MYAGHGIYLGGESPLWGRCRNCQPLANIKGVYCEVESERRWRQSPIGGHVVNDNENANKAIDFDTNTKWSYRNSNDDNGYYWLEVNFYKNIV